VGWDFFTGMVHRLVGLFSLDVPTTSYSLPLDRMVVLQLAFITAALYS
jgi:hypothetical protein